MRLLFLPILGQHNLQASCQTARTMQKHALSQTGSAATGKITAVTTDSSTKSRTTLFNGLQWKHQWLFRPTCRQHDKSRISLSQLVLPSSTRHPPVVRCSAPAAPRSPANLTLPSLGPCLDAYTCLRGFKHGLTKALFRLQTKSSRFASPRIHHRKRRSSCVAFPFCFQSSWLLQSSLSRSHRRPAPPLFTPPLHTLPSKSPSISRFPMWSG